MMVRAAKHSIRMMTSRNPVDSIHKPKSIGSGPSHVIRIMICTSLYGVLRFEMYNKFYFCI